jgi:hypothetical protein
MALSLAYGALAISHFFFRLPWACCTSRIQREAAELPKYAGHFDGIRSG